VVAIDSRWARRIVTALGSRTVGICYHDAAPLADTVRPADGAQLRPARQVMAGAALRSLRPQRHRSPRPPDQPGCSCNPGTPD
jgi:hypothetical protein